MAATANSLTPATADALALLTSELVTNAVNHAGMTATEDILLRLLDGSRLRVEVVDSGPGFDPPNAWTDGERIHGWAFCSSIGSPPRRRKSRGSGRCRRG
jgi:two-component sensor histidine kinase